VRGFPQHVLETLAVGVHVAADFLLGDDAGRGNPVAWKLRIIHVIGILILDGILDGDDVLGMVAAAPVDERGQGGGLAGTGGAGDEAEAGALEHAVAQGVGGVRIDAERLEFGDVIVEDTAGDAETGRTEVGLNPQAAGALAIIAHRNAVAGEIRHPALGEIGDGKADLLVHALVERLVLAKAVAAALAVGDELLEDPVHVGGR
jgi:hypothetical protein